jgi:hypothetical protein
MIAAAAIGHLRQFKRTDYSPLLTASALLIWLHFSSFGRFLLAS